MDSTLLLRIGEKMTTIYATWDRTKRRWKLRDVISSDCNHQSVLARRKRRYHQCASALFRIPDIYVYKVKRCKLAQAFYDWQKVMVRV